MTEDLIAANTQLIDDNMRLLREYQALSDQNTELRARIAELEKNASNQSGGTWEEAPAEEPAPEAKKEEKPPVAPKKKAAE